ncbi:ABC transporter substrate-binding protein [Halovenus sp. HT40]|uniref:ABC transporter substrate-binding protein n=1 Tax=Halovenus sp. HT40 TaxID=3126691 RepID=UPI00300F159E
MSRNVIRTRRRYLQGISAAGVVGVAGCIAEDETGENDGPDDDSEPDDDTEPDEDSEPASGDGVTIGHISPESTVLGVGSARAAALAVETVNDSGGIMDERVELVTGDTQTSAAEAEVVVEELIQQEGADVIVGGFQSEIGRAVTDLTAEFGVPYISTGPAAPDLTTHFPGDEYDRYKHYFRVGPINAALQAEAMSEYLTYLSDRHGWNSLAFYRDLAAWTEPFAEHLPALLEDQGLTIETQDSITIQNPDLSPLVSTAAEEGVDYVLRFFGHIASSPQQIFPAWRGDLDFGLEGIHIPGSHPEYDIATEGLNIYETTAQNGAGGAAPITDHTRSFIDSYVDEYAGDEFEVGTPDGSPMEMGFGTYDAIVLLQDVLNEIGTTNPEDHLDDYVDEMLSTEPGRIESVSGPIQFYGSDAEFPHDLQAARSSDGTITNFPVTQFQPYKDGNAATVEYEGVVRPGQVECVFPEPYRTADHQRPSWMG